MNRERTIYVGLTLSWMLLFSSTLLAQKVVKDIVPPNTDFSKYEPKYPWEFSEQKFAELLRSNKAPKNIIESKVGPYSLPDLFTNTSGQHIDSAKQWDAERRIELISLFQREVYGVPPPKPERLGFEVVESISDAIHRTAIAKRIRIRFAVAEEQFTFHINMFVPKARPTSGAPVFLLLNHRGPENTDLSRTIQSEFWPAEYAISRGFAMASISLSAEVDPDDPKATTGIRAFYRQHDPNSDSLTWGTLSAWAWSGSRAVDYLETDPDINASQIAVIGHSRSGKTALLAAAQDTRFALACVNGAGEGGPALTRRDFGETLGMITKNFPHWFTPRYSTYAERIDDLPIDQHALIALVAPRGYHGGDGTTDLHADPRGAWLSLVEASPVWSLYNQQEPLTPDMPMVNELLMQGPLAYHIREGGHALTTFDWKLYFDHADKIFQRK